MWHMQHGMGWWLVFGTIFWALLVVAIALLIANLTDASSRPSAPPPPRAPDDPLEIAKRRYAAGEISREQFQQLCDDLRNSASISTN
jgi:putative membrane protein